MALDDDPVDWREFLDLAEQVGGATVAADLYRDHVLTDTQIDELDRPRRDGGSVHRARRARRHLGAARGGAARRWPPGRCSPPGTRSSWPDAALDVRDEIDAALGPIDLEPAATIGLAYQESTDLEATTAELGTHLAAARRLATARLALVEQLDGLGLDPPAFTQADYDLAPVAAADDVELLEEQAGELVADSTALDETLAPYALSVPPLATDAFAESPEDALATVDTNRRAASAVADAYRDRDAAASFLERIGALGSNVDTRLDEAADRLAAGDTEAATASADAAAATLSGWDERGTARLGAVGIGLALGLALVLIARTVRNRRPSDSTD